MFKYIVLGLIFLNTAGLSLYAMHDVMFKGYSLRHMLEAKNNTEYVDRLYVLLRALAFQHALIPKTYQYQVLVTRVTELSNIINTFLPERRKTLSNLSIIDSSQDILTRFYITSSLSIAFVLRFAGLICPISGELQEELKADCLFAPSYTSERQLDELKKIQQDEDQQLQQLATFFLTYYDYTKVCLAQKALSTEMNTFMHNGLRVFASSPQQENNELFRIIYNSSYKPSCFKLALLKKYAYLGFNVACRELRNAAAQAALASQGKYTCNLTAQDHDFIRKTSASYQEYQSMQKECAALYTQSYKALKQAINQLSPEEAQVKKSTLMVELLPCLEIPQNEQPASSSVPTKKKKHTVAGISETLKTTALADNLGSTAQSAVEQSTEQTLPNNQTEQSEAPPLKQVVPDYRIAPHILQWFQDPKKAFYEHGYTFSTPSNFNFIVLIHTPPLALVPLAFKHGLVIESPSRKGPYNDIVAYFAGELFLPNKSSIIVVYSARQDGLSKVIYHHGFTQKVSGEALVQEFFDKRRWDVEYPPLVKEDVSYESLVPHISPFAAEEEFSIIKENRLTLSLLLKRHNAEFMLYKLVN